MDLHEYQTKILLKQYNLPIPRGAVIRNINETMDTIAHIGGKEWVLKAQIHATGRSQSGGIRIVANEEELYSTIKSMIGSTLITSNNAPDGQPVNQILIENHINNISREIHLTLSIDHSTAYIQLLLSIEDNSSLADNAKKRYILHHININPISGLQHYQCHELFLKLKLEARQQVGFFSIIKSLYQLFSEKDLVFLSLNPLAITTGGDFICLDAKSTSDDSALFRQASIRHMRDITQEHARIVRSKQHGFHFIQLKGPIACLVNGYGSVLSIYDLLQEKNINPASFLDLQSNIEQQSIIEAFRIILSERHIKAILVNICTRLTDCNLITEGIIAAIAELHFNLPIVICLQGYNAKSALKKLTQHNVGISVAPNLTNAINQLNQYSSHEKLL